MSTINRNNRTKTLEASDGHTEGPEYVLELVHISRKVILKKLDNNGIKVFSTQSLHIYRSNMLYYGFIE